jgi:hypothetical protein
MTTGGQLALIGYPVFVAVLALLKISVGAVFIGAGTLVYLMMGPSRWKPLATLSLVLGIVALFLVKRAVGNPSVEPTPFIPFA